MANRNITVGVKIDGTAKGFKSATEDAKRASSGMQTKIAKGGKAGTSTFGKMGGAVSKLTGTLGKAGVGAGVMSAGMAAAAGPIGAVVAVVGLMAKAWKNAEENMGKYLQTASRADYGLAGSREMAKDARKAEMDLARGQKHAGRKAATAGLFQGDDALRAEGKQMKVDARMAKREMRGGGDRAKWIREETKLLNEQLNLEIEGIRLSTQWSAIEAERSEYEKDMANTALTAAERQSAYNKYVILTNDLLKTKEDFNNRSLKNQEEVNAHTKSTVADIQKEEGFRRAVNESVTKSNKELKRADAQQKSITAQVKAEAKARGDIEEAQTARTIAPGKISLKGSAPGLVQGPSAPPELKMPAIDYQSQMDDLDSFYAQGLKSTQDYLVERRSLELGAAIRDGGDVALILKQYDDELRQNKMDNVGQYLEYAMAAADFLTQVFEASKNAELKAAGDNTKKKEEIEKKYAKKQKAMAITMAILNGALGITKTIAQLGFPAAIPGIIITAALTAANIGVIASQQFAQGGIVSGQITGTMGEYAGVKNNPEVVAPLNKLKSLLGLGTETSGGQVKFEIEGTKLVGVLEQQMRKQVSYS